MNSSLRRLIGIVASMTLGAAMCTARASTPPTNHDVKYSTHWRQGLDIYLPQAAHGPAPAVVYIHGGGWLEGDKSEAQQYVDSLLARGFAVIAINYRYSQQARFPAQLHDCKGAIRWIRAHATEYGVDASRMGVFGESAGGHLAALLATTGDEPGMEGSVGGNLNRSSAVQALVDAYGPIDLFAQAQFSAQGANEISALIGHDIHDIIEHHDDANYAGWVALVNSADPARHADPDSPPAYIFHGLADTYVSPGQSEYLAHALHHDSVEATLRLAPGVGHTLPGPERSAVWTFLEQQLGDGAGPPPVLQPIAAGAHAGDDFAAAMAFVGDLDGDGAEDLAVGAPHQAGRGRVTIYSGHTGQVLHAFAGRPGDRFGYAVAAMGDVNGDGRGDLAIGAPGSNDSGSDSDSGRVDVFAGATWQLLRSYQGEHAGDAFGSALAAVDVDGDGRRELACGAPHADGPSIDAGACFVFDGADGHRIARLRGPTSGAKFGAAIANARDCDGDGRDDIVIGAPFASRAGAAGAGCVTVYRFNGERLVALFHRYGSAGENLGASVAGIGDADGDGRDDVAAGAPHARVNDRRDAGRTLILSGASGGVIAAHADPHPQSGERFGSAIAATGDLDHDGLADIAIGASGFDRNGADRGRVWLMRGIAGSGRVIGRIDGEAAGARLGQALDDTAAQSLLATGAGGMVWNGARRGVAYLLDPLQVH